MNEMTTAGSLESFRRNILGIRTEIEKMFVGHSGLVTDLLAALMANGHILIEGVPGLGKTLLVKSLAETLKLSFSRIQFTPDLMPADIIGATVLLTDETGAHVLKFREGPLIANFILADEINRGTPKTQSALLEAMQEHQVSTGEKTIILPEPFAVIATQNPIEQEGTYPLPEAELDRFMIKLNIGYPDEADYLKILDRTVGMEKAEVKTVCSGGEIIAMQRLVRKVIAIPEVENYAVRLVMATQPGSAYAGPLTNDYIVWGAGPRAVQALVLIAKTYAILDGRASIGCTDIRRAALPVLRHRLKLNFEAHLKGHGADDLLEEIIPDFAGKTMKHRILTEELIASIRQLKIAVRAQRINRREGIHDSRTHGDSLEFHDFRGYIPGDDLRRVDWHIFQRHRKLTLRQFKHFQNSGACIILDNSASMHFDPARRAAALRAAAVIGGVLLHQNDPLELRVGTLLRDQYRNGRNDLPEFFSRIEKLAGVRATQALPPAPERRRCWIISDFLEPEGLEVLRQRLDKTRPFTPVRIFNNEDISPSLRGNLQLIDVESGRDCSVSFDRAVLERYQTVYREFTAILDAFAARGRTIHYAVNSDDTPARQLEALFPGGVMQ